MKAKLLNRQVIDLDHMTWNESGTKFGNASEFDPDYMEYVPSEQPSGTQDGFYYAPYYEEEEGIIYQRWELPTLTIDELKAVMVNRIDDYDRSSEVNEFFVSGMSMWLDRETRASLSVSIAAEESMGRNNTVLWAGDMPLELPIAMCRQMLQALEVYAKDCYNVTQQHKAAISALEEAAEISDYDYTTGYPQKLSL